MSQIWQVRLSAKAEEDLIAITRWTAEHFGPLQAEQYLETIVLAIDAVNHGSRPLDAKVRNEFGSDIYTLHIARQGRKGRHFLVYSVANDRYWIS